MEDNDEIYVMADANYPPLPTRPKRKIIWATLCLFGAFATIAGVTVVAKVVTRNEISPSTNNSPISTMPHFPDKHQGREIVKEELKIYFGFNQEELVASEMSKIESLWLKEKNGKGTINIVGHTDSLGTEEYNQLLSEKRAEKIFSILQNLGADKSYQVTTQGFGETEPADENSTESGRAKNRRVEIYLSMSK